MSLDGVGAKPRPVLPNGVEDRLVGWLYRVAGTALIAMSGFGWLSLITWTRPGSLARGQALGALGSAGAVSADFLLQTQGFAALLVFLAPAVWGWQLITRETVTRFRLKVLLYITSIVLMAGAFSSLPTLAAWPLHHGFGGMLGDVILQIGTNLIGTISADRATLLSGLAFLAGGATCALASLGLGLGDVADLMRRPTSGHGHGNEANVGADPHVLEHAPAARTPAAARRTRSTPPPEEEAYDEEDIAPDFYSRTDEASQQIARRFAPFRVDGPSPPAQNLARDEPRLPPLPEQELAATSDEPRIHRPAGPPATPPPSASPRPSQPPAVPPRQAERQAHIGYRTPSLGILARPAHGKANPEFAKNALRQNATMLESVLADFSVKGQVRDIKPGPVVTLFEFEPARGVKSSRVIGLADDIARNMSAISVRVAVVPGRNVIGIELPNMRRETVYLREILENEPFRSGGGTLPLALGKSIGGEPVVADLARMPHLLVAGTTGSGKSVGVNAMILSLLYRLGPEACRFIMIDPKMLELSVYNGIPHLLCPVVTDPQKAVAALNWVVREMEDRYQRMAKLGVRNIEAYNHRIVTAYQKGEPLVRVIQTGFDPHSGAPRYEREQLPYSPIPFIVVVVDEFADLMMVAGKEIEGAIQRLAQMARAAGIHLILATQRPSVDVITGTIKANFPTRISFKVTSKVDSRTILNEQGAEQLLGSGDMLFSGGAGAISRVHGPFVADGEVEAVVQALRQMGPPRYVEGITEIPEPIEEEQGEPTDSLFDRAVDIVAKDRKASTSYIQRRLAIGYNRAAGIIERMEAEGMIGPADATGRRDVLLPLPDDADNADPSSPHDRYQPAPRRQTARVAGGRATPPALPGSGAQSRAGSSRRPPARRGE